MHSGPLLDRLNNNKPWSSGLDFSRITDQNTPGMASTRSTGRAIWWRGRAPLPGSSKVIRGSLIVTNCCYLAPTNLCPLQIPIEHSMHITYILIHTTMHLISSRSHVIGAPKDTPTLTFLFLKKFSTNWHTMLVFCVNLCGNY